MRPGALTAVFANPALPVFGYGDSRVVADDLETLATAARARPTADVVEAPSLEIVEVPADASVYLFTRDGHFAHRSAIVRRIVQPASGPAIEVLGYTAAPHAVMTAWLEPFRVGDEAVRRGVAGAPAGVGR